MAEKLSNVIAYLLKHRTDRVSNTLLNNLVFQCDWYHALTYGQQVTGIKWYFGKHQGTGGVYVFDIKEATENNVLFDVTSDENGNYFSLKDQEFQPQIGLEANYSLDIVIRNTENLSADEVSQRVRRSYPVSSFFKSQQAMDLLEIAKKYRNSGK